MKTLTVGDCEFIVSDAVAHHVPAYWYLLYSLGRSDHDVEFPAHTDATPDQVVTVKLHREVPTPSVTEYEGPLGDPADPEDVTGLLEDAALTLLSDLGTIYSHASSDWRKWLDERASRGKPIPPMPDPD